MSKRQAKRDKANAKAAEVVDKAIDTALSDKVKATFPNSAAVVAEAASKPKRGALSPEHAALAPKVKELREKGLAWWQIGYELKLPGSADTVAKGKGGAAFARKIWKSAFGEVPRVQNRDGSRRKIREKNDHVREMRTTTKTARVEAVRQGTSVIKPETTPDEIVAMIEGRMITWSMNLANVDGQGDEFFDCTAGVFKGTARVHGLGEDRYVEFREYDPRTPLQYRGIPGGSRLVRVASIHTVGGHA